MISEKKPTLIASIVCLVVDREFDFSGHLDDIDKETRLTLAAELIRLRMANAVKVSLILDGTELALQIDLANAPIPTNGEAAIQ
jgi:hypothetical protein